MSALMGQLPQLSQEVPEGLIVSRQTIESLLQAVYQRDNVKTSQIVFAGFSQGAILSTDIVAHLPEQPAALCIFSGVLLCRDVWKAKLPSRKGLKVLQTHGTQDQILPFVMAEWLSSTLKQSGLDLDFISFNGQHTVPPEAVERFAKLINSL